MSKKLLGLGLPSAVQYVFEVGAFFFAVIMVGWLGTKQLAAHQIALNLASISFMTALGVSAAVGIRVANGVVKKDITEFRRAGFSAVIVGGLMMTLFIIFFIFFIPRHRIPEIEVYLFVNTCDISVSI